MKKFLALALIAAALSSSSVFAVDPTFSEKVVTALRVWGPWYSKKSNEAKQEYYENLSKGAQKQEDKDALLVKAGSYKTPGYTTKCADKVENNPLKSVLTAGFAAAVVYYGYKFRTQIKEAFCSKCPFTKKA